MKKIIVSVCSVLIIVVSLIFIQRLLYDDGDLGDKTTTTISFGEYDLFDYGGNYASYVISDLEYFDYLLDGFDIRYENNILTINEKEFTGISKVYKYFAIYDKSVLVMGITTEDGDAVLTYNYKLEHLEMYDNYKGMLVGLDRDLVFEDAGFLVNYTNIKDNKYIKGNKDICKIKEDGKITAYLAVEYYYDKSAKKFLKSEELYSTNLFVYKRDNNLCK